jgi:hypothetical protein
MTNKTGRQVPVGRSPSLWLERFLRFGPAIAVMVAIFYFSSRTGDDLHSLLPFFQTFFPGIAGFDWGHFIAYFMLALTFMWAVTDGKLSWGEKLAAIALSFLYGLTDEFHQRYVPGRAPDWMDIRNDVIGATLAMLFISLPGISGLARKWRVSIKSRR